MSSGPPLPDTPADHVGGKLFARFLQGAAVLALALSAVAAVLGSAGQPLSIALVALLIAAPLVRVLWLTGHFWHQGDRRFAVVAIALLAVIATGTVIATLQ